VPIYFRLGSEFMPPLNEGTILYMPTALPGMSITQARAAIQTQDRMIKEFPEVATVFGKAGRAEDADRPGAHQHVRDRRDSETGERVAGRA